MIVEHWHKMSPFLFLAITTLLLCLAAIDGDEKQQSTTVTIPIELKNPDHSIQHENFIFDFSVRHLRLEFSVLEFCEKHNIRGSYCATLYSVAEQNVKDLKRKYYLDTDINTVNQKLAPNDNNPHLNTHPQYQESLFNFTHAAYRSNMISKLSELEDRAVAVVTAKLKAIQSFVNIQRIVFIHSVLYEGQTPDILRELLSSLQSKGLYWDSNVIILLHYGQYLPSSFPSAYPEVLMIHSQNDTSFLELLTLRILQKTAKLYHSLYPSNNPHILYLHTLGQEYDVDQFSTTTTAIYDLRHMIIYHLIDNYRKAYHLLSSKNFDVVSVNYYRQIDHNDGIELQAKFHGNCWWTTVTYLANGVAELDLLTTIEPLLLQQWIFHVTTSAIGQTLRFYSFHNSHVDDHNKVPYPHYCYTNHQPLLKEEREDDKEEVPDFLSWSNICDNTNRHDYDRLFKSSLHHNEDNNLAVYDDEKVATRVNKAECKGLEITFH